MNKTIDNRDYINSQFEKLVPSPYAYTIKITDGFGNSTNYLNITSDELTQLLNILTNTNTKKE
jgi:hypothetical protein